MRLLRRFARRVGYRLFHWGIRGRLDGVHVAADAGRRAVLLTHAGVTVQLTPEQARELGTGLVAAGNQILGPWPYGRLIQPRRSWSAIEALMMVAEKCWVKNEITLAMPVLFFTRHFSAIIIRADQ